VWKLKEYVQQTHNLRTAAQLQAFIQEKVGVKVTVQTVRALLRGPAAPRVEMIQLLCDALECSSPAFYLVIPNSERAQQWSKERMEGKQPSSLYQPKQPKAVDTILELALPAVNKTNAGKRKSLKLTFTDPRTLFQDTLGSGSKSIEQIKS
jgi:hypothetical protein